MLNRVQHDIAVVTLNPVLRNLSIVSFPVTLNLFQGLKIKLKGKS